MRELGYTMMPSLRFPPWRPDNIIMRGNKGYVWEKEEHEIAIVGGFSIPPYEANSIYDIAKDGMVRTPSYHMGLLANICI